MNLRRFFLENEYGQKYDMNDAKKSCLLTEPSELGVSFEGNFQQLGNTFIETEKRIGQKNPSGVLNFKKYEQYKNFIDFIQKSSKLKYIYEIPLENGYDSYCKDVTIQSIGKTEKEAGFISCPIVFNGLSLWYKSDTATYTLNPIEGELRWDFEWNPIFSDYSTTKFDYINKGHVDASLELEIDGNIKNPKIELYIEGELYQTISIDTQINLNEKLLYSSKENNFFIKKQLENGTEESLFDLDIINFANDNVLRIPPNKSCEIRLSADTEISSAQVTIYTYFISV